MSRSRSAVLATLWLPLALLGALSPAGMADETAANADEELRAPEPLETEFVRLRNMIMNAQSKLRNGVQGMSATGPLDASTPARVCCSSNLLRIDERLREIDKLLESFERCYEERLDPEMVTAVQFVKADMAGFRRTVQRFAEAPDRRQASGVLDAVSRGFLLLRETGSKLTPCVTAAESPSETDSPDGTQVREGAGG